MQLIAKLSVREVHSLTMAYAIEKPDEWDRRTMAYWRAYARRFQRELVNGAETPASECLIALSGAMLTRLDRLRENAGLTGY